MVLQIPRYGRAPTVFRPRRAKAGYQERLRIQHQSCRGSVRQTLLEMGREDRRWPDSALQIFPFGSGLRGEASFPRLAGNGQVRGRDPSQLILASIWSRRQGKTCCRHWHWVDRCSDCPGDIEDSRQYNPICSHAQPLPPNATESSHEGGTGQTEAGRVPGNLQEKIDNVRWLPVRLHREEHLR